MNPPVWTTVLLLTMLLVIDANGQQRHDDEIFDPPPSVLPSAKQPLGRAKEPSKSIVPFHESKNIAERHLSRELIGFKPGAYIQPEMRFFDDKVTSEIQILKRWGFQLTRVAVRGFADGLRNKGLIFNATTIPERCRQGVSRHIVLSDPDLAFLRSCIVWDDLSSRLGELTGQPVWLRDTYDIPDGGPSGPQYRKVVIELWMFKEHK